MSQSYLAGSQQSHHSITNCPNAIVIMNLVTTIMIFYDFEVINDNDREKTYVLLDYESIMLLHSQTNHD